MTEREKAILWLSSFVKNKEPMTLIPKQLIRLMYEALKEQPEIVRCKDCDNKECWGRAGDVVCGIDGTPHRPDWFCADGERNDNDGTY